MMFEHTSLKIHRAGWPFIGLFAAVTVGLAFLGGPLFALGLVLTAWCIYFFSRSGTGHAAARRPDRQPRRRQNRHPRSDARPRPRTRRHTPHSRQHLPRRLQCPCEPRSINGAIKRRIYRKGKFVNASLDKASVDNERMALVLQMSGGHPYAGQMLGVVQIAELVARRLCAMPRKATR